MEIVVWHISREFVQKRLEKHVVFNANYVAVFIGYTRLVFLDFTKSK